MKCTDAEPALFIISQVTPSASWWVWHSDLKFRLKTNQFQTQSVLFFCAHSLNAPCRQLIGKDRLSVTCNDLKDREIKSVKEQGQTLRLLSCTTSCSGANMAASAASRNAAKGTNNESRDGELKHSGGCFIFPSARCGSRKCWRDRLRATVQKETEYDTQFPATQLPHRQPETQRKSQSNQQWSGRRILQMDGKPSVDWMEGVHKRRNRSNFWCRWCFF